MCCGKYRLITKYVISTLFLFFYLILVDKGKIRLAGILSGLPTASLLSIIFLAFEHDVQFAAKTAAHCIEYIPATVGLLVAFYLIARKPYLGGTAVAAIISLLVFAISSYLLSLLNSGGATSLVLSLIVVFVFNTYCLRLKTYQHRNLPQKTVPQIFIQASLASLIVVFAVTLSSRLGSSAGGFLIAFPASVFPMLIIANQKFGCNVTTELIKNLSTGLVCWPIFMISTSTLLPILGLYGGIISAIFIVLISVALYQKLQSEVSSRIQSNSC